MLSSLLRFNLPNMLTIQSNFTVITIYEVKLLWRVVETGLPSMYPVFLEIICSHYLCFQAYVGKNSLLGVFFVMPEDMYIIDLIIAGFCKVAASTQKEADAHIPNYPSIPPRLVCLLDNVTLHVRVVRHNVHYDWSA